MKRYLDIYDYFGGDNQRRKLVEEIYEFLEAVIIYEHCKNEENENFLKMNVTEEMADVLLLLTEFIAEYGIEKDAIEDFIDAKLGRTEERIENGYYNK